MTRDEILAQIEQTERDKAQHLANASFCAGYSQCLKDMLVKYDAIPPKQDKVAPVSPSIHDADTEPTEKPVHVGP